MTIDTITLLAGPVVMLLAYTVFGISGFGSALVSIPLLAHMLPLRLVVPTVLLLDFSAAALSGWRFRHQVVRTEVRSVAPFLVVGAVAGVFLLARAPGDALLLPLGMFVAAYGAINALRHDRPLVLAPGWAPVIGFLGGLLGALYGVGGPLYASYFSGRLRDPVRLRATLSATFSLSTGLRIALLLLSGLLLDITVCGLALFLFPWTLLGTRFGRRLQPRLPPAIASRFVSALLVLSGASLMIRALDAG
jgi:uncharacterized membrane protein YfcA